MMHMDTTSAPKTIIDKKNKGLLLPLGRHMPCWGMKIIMILVYRLHEICQMTMLATTRYLWSKQPALLVVTICIYIRKVKQREGIDQ